MTTKTKRSTKHIEPDHTPILDAKPLSNKLNTMQENCKLDHQSNFLKTYKETKKWLDKMNIKNYTINNETLVVDAHSVDLSYSKLTHIPVKFGLIQNTFDISYNPELTSLVGSPDTSYSFKCSSTGISNFDGIGDSYKINANRLKNLTSFRGLRDIMSLLSIVGSCHNILDLEFFPKELSYLEIGDDFRLLKYMPEHITNLHVIHLFAEPMEVYDIPSILGINGINVVNNFECQRNKLIDFIYSAIYDKKTPMKTKINSLTKIMSYMGYDKFI